MRALHETSLLSPYADDGEDEPADLLNEVWDRRADIYSVAEQNDLDIGHLLSYLAWRYPPNSIIPHADSLLEQPFLCRSVIDNWLLTNEQKWDLLRNCLGLPKPRIRIIYIVGEPGGGKSLLAYQIARAIHEMSGRPVVEIGDSTTQLDFVERIPGFDQTPHGAVFIDQEAAVNNNAREGGSREGRDLGPGLATIRHNDCIGIWVSQNSAMADKNLLRMAQMIAFKPIGMMAGDTENVSLRRRLQYWEELIPMRPSQSFILSKHLQPLRLALPVPSWYTDAISTGYGRIRDRRAAIDLAVKIRTTRPRWGKDKIASRLGQRTVFNYSGTTWMKLIIEACGGVDPATGRAPYERKKDSGEEPPKKAKKASARKVA